MRHIRSLAFVLACIASAATVSYAAPRVETVPFPKGISGKPITITTERFGSGPVLINVHENEATSVQAARVVLKRRGGLLVTLEQSGARNISVRFGPHAYVVDPNRMFSREGIIASLEALSNKVDNTIVDFIDDLGMRLLVMAAEGAYPDKKVIIALHNNTDGDLSIESYSSKKPFRHGVARTSTNPRADPDDFFLVTDAQVYDALVKQGKWNVVLQDSASVSNDGSLSVLSGQYRVSYVNVESQHGHLSMQIDMINAIYDVMYATD